MAFTYHTPQIFTPGRPFFWRTWGTSVVPVTVVDHPEYEIVWDNDDLDFFGGANGPLRWLITRADGTECALPLSAAVSLLLPDGTLPAPVEPDMPGPDPSPFQALSTLLTFSQEGEYLAALTVTMQDGTILTDTQLIEVRGLLTPGATYDETQLPTSKLYQVRKYAADTDVRKAIFSDAEIQSFLNENNQIVLLAASMAVLTIANSKSRLAQMIKIGTYGRDHRTVYQALLELSKELYARAPMLPMTSSPDEVFSLDSGGGTTLGTMTKW